MNEKVLLCSLDHRPLVGNGSQIGILEVGIEGGKLGAKMNRRRCLLDWKQGAKSWGMKRGLERERPSYSR